MPRLEFHRLSELRDEAARLLAERYRRQRAAEPLLPDVDDFEAHVPAEGLVAIREGEAVAYLSGEVDGPVARVGFGGHAAAEPEALRDLFAAEAERWAVTRFAVAVPAGEESLVDAWFRLAFGCQFVWAVREVEPAEPVDFGGTIRPATRDDTEAIVDFDELLHVHQRTAPSFSGYVAPPRAEVRAEVWADDAWLPFVAERDGQPVGLLGLYRRPEGGLRVPANNIDLSFAVTQPGARGSGVGRALTAYALNWAHEHGYRSMTVDWRTVNLLSSRFWEHRGFRPQYLRLYRAVP